MRLFHNDYNEMCHPAVLRYLQEISSRQMDGYGDDDCCSSAAERIKALCENDSLSVHFLVGGTQTNLTVIAAALRPHQAVIGAESAHIQVHETGAVEATGHKVLSLPSADGKITAEQIRNTAQAHLDDVTHEHIAQPKMVYISQPTELGTTYSLAELEQISQACKQYGLYLFVDGARLGYALSAADNDVTLQDLANLTDVFYIGGTKVGAMFGEAVVISNTAITEDFRYIIKQRGGMLAKGWLLGAQFEVLFKDGLYFEISKYANRLADKLRDTLVELGYPILVQCRTNQVFTVLPNTVLQKLEKEFSYAPWGTVDDNHTAVRFCTSWATMEDSLDALCDALTKITANS
ncbi:MAG: aminotransferase class I/II-fold pyridoxal phosphate-dependent enzyme [Oscillospiraceae bacterium]|nr:aminotransferase class I/II-fold pyridoxal phosphate-dependent enzyme [Oscillospiraceae bacterium]